MWLGGVEPDMPDKSVSRFRKSLTIAAAPIGVILLGAVGSGVWDRLGSSFFDWIARAIITAVSALFGTYKDSIYREASVGFHEHAATSLYALAMGAAVGMCISFVVLIGRRRGNSSSKSDASRISRVFQSRVFAYVVVLAVLSFAAVSFFRDIYVAAVVVYAESSIDRLAPYLTDAEEEELVAQFRNVRGAEDYYAFYSRLLEIYEAHGLDHRSVPPL